MKPNVKPFQNVVSLLLEQLEASIKQCKKTFSRIRNLADNPELKKALHEEQTYIADHLTRLKLIRKESATKTSKILQHQMNEIITTPFKKKNEERDLWFIAQAQEIIYQKIALYKVVYRMLMQSSLTHAPMLLEQTIVENEATATWLENIAQRILNGDHIVPVVAEEHLIQKK